MLESRRQSVDLSHLKGVVDQETIELIGSCLAFNVAERPTSAQYLVDVLAPKLRIAGSLAVPSRRAKWLRTLLPAAVMIGLLGTYVYSARMSSGLNQFEAAKNYFQNQKYSLAIESLTRALDADGSLIDARVLRGRAHQKLEQYDSAFNDYNAACKPSRNPQLFAAMGFCRAARGLHKEAIFYYLKAIDAGYATAAVYNNLGYSYYRIGQTDEALKNINRASEFDTNLQAPFLNRATFELNKALSNGGELPTNVYQDVSHAIKLGPPSGELFYEAATIYARGVEANSKFRDMTFEFLTQAVLHGYDVKSIDENLFKDFRQDSEYQSLLLLHQQPETIKAAQRTVDPLQ